MKAKPQNSFQYHILLLPLKNLFSSNTYLLIRLNWLLRIYHVPCLVPGTKNMVMIMADAVPVLVEFTVY